MAAKLRWMDGVPRERLKVTQQNAEETMPDSTMENVMTKNTSCAPYATIKTS
jgi:hypothetical protein